MSPVQWWQETSLCLTPFSGIIFKQRSLNAAFLISGNGAHDFYVLFIGHERHSGFDRGNEHTILVLAEMLQLQATHLGCPGRMRPLRGAFAG